MKQTAYIFVFALMLILTAVHAGAQKIDTTGITSGKMYIVTKNDGSTFTGKIISMDAREVLMDTKTIGQVSIPKHEIKEIRAVSASEITATGEFKRNETFATRYFVTTNGLPIAKGESYVIFNWYGPDMQFGVGKNFGVGVMTSWVGMPVIGTAKFSFALDENTHMAVGSLLGTGSWALPHFGLALPFASITYGNRRNNLTFSGGYGTVWYEHFSGGRALFSVAGMAQLSKKASIVFDSFIMPGNKGSNEYVAFYMPGIRLQTAPNKAFQFGFVGLATTSGFVPIPMFQWFRML